MEIILMQPIGALRGHDWEVSVTLSPDGTRLVSATTSPHYRPVYLWDTAQQKLLRELEGHQGLVSEIAYAHDGQYLATACADGMVRLWTRDGDLLAVLPGHENGATAVAFACDSALLFTGDGRGRVRLWDILTQQILFSLSGSPLSGSTPHQQAPEDAQTPSPIRHMAYSPSQMLLAIERSTPGGDIHVWQFNRERPGLQWTGTSLRGTFSQFVFSPDGHMLAGLAFEEETLWVRAGNTFASETRITLPPSWGWGFAHGLIAVRFSPDGRFLAIGGSDGEIGFWDLSHQVPVTTVRAYPSLRHEAAPFPSLTGLDWSHSGLLATGGWDPKGDVSLLQNNFVATLWNIARDEDTREESTNVDE